MGKSLCRVIQVCKVGKLGRELGEMLMQDSMGENIF